MHKIAVRFDYSVFIWYDAIMKIMIDIDGCIGDFSAMIASYINHPELPEPDDYSYHKATEWKNMFPTGKSFMNVFMDAIAHHGYLNEPVIGNAVEIIRELHDDGNEIIIGTNRGFPWLKKSRAAFINQNAHDDTIQWLNDNGIIYDNIVFTASKHDIDADVYIEDRPVNIDELRERGHKVIMFAHAYNASTESDWIAYDWNDVHDIIKTMNA